MCTAVLRSPRFLAGLALLLASCWVGLPATQAQVQVDIKMSRRTYILYEPIIATVTITNNAGRDITLQDEQGTQWLNFEVSQIGGSIVQPYDPNYELPPLTIAAGKTLEKRIDLTPSFPIREMGSHRVRVDVYFADIDKYFYSNYATFDLTDGRQIWMQTVGKPGSEDDIRQVSLLTHQLPDKMLLYARVRDEHGNNVYTTQSLGRMIVTGNAPQEMLDRANTLHVMQEAAPGNYMYTAINIDGQRVDQKVYTRQGTSRPKLVKGEDGEVSVRGGQVQVAAAVPAGGPASGPKLSDRPTGMPGAAARKTGN